MSELSLIDGLQNGPEMDIADFVIVGSGPGGATAARVLSEAGFELIILEEGGAVDPQAIRNDTWSAFRNHWRDQSLQVAQGKAFWPILQGCSVGGTTTINGAIIHRLPPEIHHNWQQEGRLSEHFKLSEFERIFDQLDNELHVQPVREEIRGNNNRLFAKGANALGWKNNIIQRNEADCQGTGRCSQVCPSKAKQSMDRTFLPYATARGTRLYSHARVARVEEKNGRATGVSGHYFNPVTRSKGRAFSFQARHGVLLAAGVVHTPVIMQNSGLRRASHLIGERFMGHPGTSILARFPDEVGMFRGATQGHESTHYWHEGMKFEVVGVSPAVAAARLPGFGASLFQRLNDLPRTAHWGLQIRAEAVGKVRAGRFGMRPSIRYSFTRADVAKMKLALSRLVELAFAAGAESVVPGVYGLPAEISSPDAMRALHDLPDDPRLFHGICAHLFGTASMGGTAQTGVVDHNGESFALSGLFVVDASVLPTNMGVNPQHTICAFSWLIAEELRERFQPS